MCVCVASLILFSRPPVARRWCREMFLACLVPKSIELYGLEYWIFACFWTWDNIVRVDYVDDNMSTLERMPNDIINAMKKIWLQSDANWMSFAMNATPADEKKRNIYRKFRGGLTFGTKCQCPTWSCERAMHTIIIMFSSSRQVYRPLGPSCISCRSEVVIRQSA